MSFLCQCVVNVSIFWRVLSLNSYLLNVTSLCTFIRMTLTCNAQYSLCSKSIGEYYMNDKKKRSVLFSKCFVIVIDIYFTFWLPCAFVLVGSEVYKHFFFLQYQNRTTWPPLGLGFGPPCWVSLLWPYAAQALFCKGGKDFPVPRQPCSAWKVWSGLDRCSDLLQHGHSFSGLIE